MLTFYSFPANDRQMILAGFHCGLPSLRYCEGMNGGAILLGVNNRAYRSSDANGGQLIDADALEGFAEAYRVYEGRWQAAGGPGYCGMASTPGY